MPSIRESIAQELREFVFFAALADDYAVGYRKVDKNGKSYYTIPMCRETVVDGIIKVHSPGRIAVVYKTKGKVTKKTFNSVYNTKRGLMMEFV